MGEAKVNIQIQTWKSFFPKVELGEDFIPHLGTDLHVACTVEGRKKMTGPGIHRKLGTESILKPRAPG